MAPESLLAYNGSQRPLPRVRHLLRDDHIPPRYPHPPSPTVIARHHDLYRLHNSDRVIQRFLLELCCGLFSLQHSGQSDDSTSSTTLKWHLRGTFDLASLSSLGDDGSRKVYSQTPLYSRLRDWEHYEKGDLNVSPLMDLRSTGGALVVVQHLPTWGDALYDTTYQTNERLDSEDLLSTAVGSRQLSPDVPSQPLLLDQKASHPLNVPATCPSSAPMKRSDSLSAVLSTSPLSNAFASRTVQTQPNYALSSIVTVLKTTDLNYAFGYLHTFTHLISAYAACGCQLALYGQGVRFARHIMLDERTVLVETNDDDDEPRPIGDIDAFLSYIKDDHQTLPRSYGDPYKPDLEAYEAVWDILRTAVMAVLDVPLDGPLKRLRRSSGTRLNEWRDKFGKERADLSADRKTNGKTLWAKDDHPGETSDYLHSTTDVYPSPLRETWFRDEFQHAAWEIAWREKRERETFIGLRAAMRQEGTVFVGGGRSVFQVLLGEMRESL